MFDYKLVNLTSEHIGPVHTDKGIKVYLDTLNTQNLRDMIETILFKNFQFLLIVINIFFNKSIKKHILK